MIGIFDSGSGGLTVLSALRRELPSADIMYFGDTAHAPYGPRSREEITRLTVEALRRLTERGAERIVSACNSVSASLAVSLYDTILTAPDALIEMVGPTVAWLRDVPERLLVVATEATIRSEIYQNAFRMVGKDVAVCAIPLLAGAIEAGESREELARIIAESLTPEVLENADAVVLACTHYPLALDAFRAVVPPAVPLIDPAEAVARRAKKLWWPREAGNGSLRFLISKDSVQFRSVLARLFPDASYEVEVVE